MAGPVENHCRAATEWCHDDPTKGSAMKYVLMFTSRPDLAESVDPERAQAVYRDVYHWFQEHGEAGHIAENGAELHAVTTATTVRFGDGGPVVVDGPFNEAKEIVGGFTVLDVPDMDAAVEDRPLLAAAGVPRCRDRDPPDGRGLLAVRGVTPPPVPVDSLLAQVLREEAGPLVARLSRRHGDFDLAEEAVQSAVLEAVTAWRRHGAPDNPAAWLTVAAQRNALDAVRRAVRQRGLAERAGAAAPSTGSDAPATDDRLALLFACCHPTLAPEARLALTLRAVIGLTTPQIARAFLVNETTLAQRIVRAKKKVVTAGISLTVPDEADLAGPPRRRARRRLRDVQRGLRVLHRHHPGPRPRRRRRLAGRGRGHLAAAVGRGLGAGRAAHRPARPGRRPLRPPRRAGAAPRPGPLALGPRRRRGRRGDARAGRRAPRPGSLPAAGRDRRLPRDGGVVGGDRLAPDRHALRPAAPPRRLARGGAQPGGRTRPARTGPGGARRWPRSTRWSPSSRRTTCGTRRAPSCSRPSGASRRRTRPTNARWR